MSKPPRFPTKRANLRTPDISLWSGFFVKSDRSRCAEAAAPTSRVKIAQGCAKRGLGLFCRTGSVCAPKVLFPQAWVSTAPQEAIGIRRKSGSLGNERDRIQRMAVARLFVNDHSVVGARNDLIQLPPALKFYAKTMLLSGHSSC